MADLSVQTDAPPDRTRVRRWTELCIVVGFLIIPGLFNAVYPDTPLLDPLYYVYGMIVALSRIGVVLYVAFINDGSLRPLGFSKFKAEDVAVAAAIMLGYWVVGMLGEQLLHGHASIVSWLNSRHAWLVVPPNRAPTWLGMLFGIFLAVQREIAARAYAQTRLQALTSPAIAIAVTVVLFSIANLALGFEVWQGEVLLSLVSALAFALNKRIWPVVIAHTAVHCLALLAAYGVIK